VHITGSPLATAHVRSINRSILILDRINGALHLSGLTKCTVVAATRQFRLHDSRDVDVYLRCASEPVIEDCEDVRFAPLVGSVDTAEGGRSDEGPNSWDQVKDFKWLADGVNPHWRRLEDRERVDDGVWEEVLTAPEGTGTEELLRLVRKGT